MKLVACIASAIPQSRSKRPTATNARNRTDGVTLQEARRSNTGYVRQNAWKDRKVPSERSFFAPAQRPGV